MLDGECWVSRATLWSSEQGLAGDGGSGLVNHGDPGAEREKWMAGARNLLLASTKELLVLLLGLLESLLEEVGVCNSISE